MEITINGITYPENTPLFILDENYRNFTPSSLNVVAVEGDNNSSTILLQTPRYYRDIDLSTIPVSVYWKTKWLDDEGKPSIGSKVLTDFVVEEDKIYFAWILTIDQTYKSDFVDFGLRWENKWTLDTRTCPFKVQRFFNSEEGYIAPSVAEDLQKQIDKEINNRIEADNILQTNIDNIKADLVGQKTSQGGEIFNDYDTNKALGLFSHTQGTNNITGCLGYKIISTNPDQYVEGMESITFTLNTDNEHFANLAIDDIVSWRVDWNYNYAGTITAVDSTAKTVTVNGVWGEEQPAFNPDELYDNYLWVPNKPEAGDQPLGLGSSTTGINNINNGDGSVVEGKGNISDGRWSHIEGKNNKGAYLNHIEGQKNISYAQSVHIEGEENSVEEGAINAHIEGSKNIVTKTGYFSHTQGRANENSGQVTHIEGLRTKATKNAVGGHAEGGSDEGNFTVVNNYFAHAENEQTQANGRGSHSQGLRTQANGDYSDSSGVDTRANGRASRATGSQTQANGVASVSEGIITEANSRAAESHGIKTIANGYSQFVVGQYNEPIGSGSSENPTNAPTIDDIVYFIVGNGTNDNDRSNAFTVHKDGHAEVKAQGGTSSSVAQVSFVEEKINEIPLVGRKGTGSGAEIFNNYTSNKASGQYAHAQGNQTTADGAFSTAMGDRNTTKGSSSLASGVINETQARASTALGIGNIVTGYAQTVVGQYAKSIGGAGESPTQSDTTYFIVGNGTSASDRSNAFNVNKDGTAQLQVTGTTDDSVPRKDYVDNKITEVNEVTQQNKTDISNLSQELSTEKLTREQADNNLSTNITNLTNTTTTALNDRYTKSETYNRTEIDQKVAGAFKFKGEVESYDKLPKDAKEGDVYQVGDKEYAWNGSSWVELGFNVDLTDYIKTTDAESKIATAKQEAIDTSKTYTDGQIQTVNSNIESNVETLNTSLNNKVDKSTTANTVYAVNNNGQQTNISYTTDATRYTLAYREDNGALKVGTPTINTHATTKEYVDTGITTEKERAQAIEQELTASVANKIDTSAFEYNEQTKTLTITIA